MKTIILQGTPCAGKSTWAREFVTGKKDWCIISRDDLRHSFGDYWDNRREKMVEDMESQMIQRALAEGMNIVIDGTNLNPSRVSHIEKIGC